jgi:protease I
VKVDKVGPNTLVSSRKPGDLPAFCAALRKEFAKQFQPA